MRRGKARLACATVLACAGVALAFVLPAGASADTIVYAQDGNIMIARPDGSGARLVAAHPADSGAYEHEYRWPSMSDTGVIAAADVSELPASAGPLLGGDAGGTFELFDQQGHHIRSLPGFTYILTPWTRISPDGTRIAWASYDGTYALRWESTAAGTTGPTAAGVPDRGRPVWLDDDHLMTTYASHGDDPRFSWNWQFGSYEVDHPDQESAWFTEQDRMIDDANPGACCDFDDFYPAVSRDHRTLAIDEAQTNTSNNTDATAPSTWKRILRLYSLSGVPPQSTAAPTLRCQISLSGIGADMRRNAVSFSPDGTQLALDSDAGIEVANVTDLSADSSGQCLHVTPRLVLPGGHQPFWSPVALQPPAPVPQPNPAPHPTPQTCCAPAPQPTCCAPGPHFDPASVAEYALGTPLVASLESVDRGLAGAGLVYVRRGSTGHRLTLGASRTLAGAFVCGSAACRVTISPTVTFPRPVRAASARRRGRTRQGRLRLRVVHLHLGAERGARFTIRLSRAQQAALSRRRDMRITLTFVVKTVHGTRRASYSYALQVRPSRRPRRDRHHQRRAPELRSINAADAQARHA